MTEQKQPTPDELLRQGREARARGDQRGMATAAHQLHDLNKTEAWLRQAERDRAALSGTPPSTKSLGAGGGAEWAGTYAAIKVGDDGQIEAYALRWGSAAEPDRSSYKDYFTPATDLMLDEWGWPRPILLEHMVTPEGEAAGSIGRWLHAIKDRVGVKLVGKLNTAHRMYSQLVRDIKAGKYFLSSDSAAHLVKRRRNPDGTHEVTRWGLLTASLTKTPAEPRLLPVAALKALSLKAGARHSAGDRVKLQSIHDDAVSLGAACGKTIDAARKRALEDRALDLELELDAIEEEVQRKSQLQRRSNLLERAGRLEETRGQQRARLLREINQLQRDVERSRPRRKVLIPDGCGGSYVKEVYE